MKKRRITEEMKMKLIYSGELLIFSIIFIVLGILEGFKVINLFTRIPELFYWLTLLGGIYLVFDWIRVIASKKYREKSSMIDKFIGLPLGLTLLAYDLAHLIFKVDLFDLRIMLTVGFIYNGLNYLFQGIYHYFIPIPGLVEDKLENLIIRRFRLVDVLDLAKLKNISEEEAKNIVNERMFSSDYYAITLKENSKLIGEIYLKEEGKKGDLSFELDPSYLEKDYAYEAVNFVVKETLKEGVIQIKSEAKKDDLVTINVLEKIKFEKYKEDEEKVFYQKIKERK